MKVVIKIFISAKHQLAHVAVSDGASPEPGVPYFLFAQKKEVGSANSDQ